MTVDSLTSTDRVRMALAMDEAGYPYEDPDREYVADLLFDHDRLLAVLEQIRGFVAVMNENNWRDMRLHIERQCGVIAKAEGKS